jgi:hypothetical protein
MVEPEYLDFTTSEENLPIVYESIDGDWNIDVALDPPEGFVYNPDSVLTVHVNNQDAPTGAVEFAITDTGSEWTLTKIHHMIHHNGRSSELILGPQMFNSQIGYHSEIHGHGTSGQGNTRDRGRAGEVPDPDLYPTHLKVHPNPFNPLTTLSYDVPVDDAGKRVDVHVLDMSGRLVAQLVDEPQAAGSHTISWDASLFQSGSYVAAVRTATHMQSRQMILLR